MDAMIDTMTVGHTYFVRLFPEKINDVNRAALFMYPENSAEPSLAVDGFVFQAQLHSTSARLNAEVWNVRVKSQISGQSDPFPELLDAQHFLRLTLHERKRENSIS